MLVISVFIFINSVNYNNIEFLINKVLDVKPLASLLINLWQ